MPYLQTPAVRLHYQQTGQGPDVVLIHAATSNLSLWVFCGLIEALGRDWRVTAYDLRGHGLSETTSDGYTSAEMAGDLMAIFDALELRPAFLVGHSFGGVIAMHAALLYPERVRGVILSDSYFPGLAHIEPNLPHADVWMELQGHFRHIGLELGESVNFTTLFRLVAELTPEQRKAIRERMGASSSRWLAGLPGLAQTTCGRDMFLAAGLTAEALATIRQPVVALYDEHSPFQATYEYLCRHLPNCTGDIVPGAKHLAPVENPAGFISLVRSHLGAWR